MTKLDEALVKAQCKVISEGAKLKNDKLSKRSKYARLCIMAIIAMSALLMLSCTAFAAEETTSEETNAIANGIAGGMSSLYGLLRMVAIPIAAVAAVFAAFQIFAGGEKGMEKAKKVLLYTGIGIAVALLGPMIVKAIATWFQGVTHDVSVFNG